MKTEQYQRLLPFLHRKSSRQRVILFLIAKGYTIGELAALSLREARLIELPADIDAYRAEAFNGRKSGLAFIYPNGNPMRLSTYHRLVRDTALKVLGRPLSQEAFREYIKSTQRSLK